jgi:hypothetical protein
VTVVFQTEEITLPVRFDAKFSVLQRAVEVTELKAETRVTLRLGPDGDRLFSSFSPSSLSPRIRS